MTTMPTGSMPEAERMGFEVGHAGLHGACGDEDFGHEDHVVTELDADDGHAIKESVVEDVIGGVTLGEATLW